MTSSISLMLQLALAACSVDASKIVGDVRGVGAGLLHGFTDDGSSPPIELVRPLHLRTHRTRPRAVLAQAKHLQSLGITHQVVLSDGWGYRGAFPGDGGDWSKWEAFVEAETSKVREAMAFGAIELDVWNEPDHPDFWPRPEAQFRETWTRAVRIIRRIAPGLPIVGPSWSNVHPGTPRFAAFLDHARSTGTFPDVVSWHFPRDVVTEAAFVRRYLQQHQLGGVRLSVNEYIARHERLPSVAAYDLAELERSSVDSACHSAWQHTRDLDELVVQDRHGEFAPTASWWVYRLYGSLPRAHLAAVPQGSIAALPARADDGTIAILVGRKRGTGAAQLEVCGLEAPIGRSISVLLTTLAPAGGNALAQLPPPQPLSLPQISAGHVAVPLPFTDSHSAYMITILPER